jgi:hypothetical protein
MPVNQQSFEYEWLIPDCTLDVTIAVGAGHTGQLRAAVLGQPPQQATNLLHFDAGATNPLVGEILRIKADVTVGALSPTPPPPALVTVTLFQKDPQGPGAQLLPSTLDFTGAFGPDNVCRMDFGIKLK